MSILGKTISELIRPEVLGMTSYPVQDARGLIKLDAMENPYRWPEEMIADWQEQLRQVEINRYPDPCARRLSDVLRVANHVPDGSDIMLGNGSDELIQIILMGLAKEGATVLAPHPSFVMYRQIAASLGMSFVGVDLQADSFALDMSAMREAIQRRQPSVIFLAYPNNPTGNCFATEDVVEILRLAPGLVVVDEAYAPYATTSFMSALTEFPNLLVMRTLSKLGLAGLRLGFLVGHPAWIGQFDKLRLPYNINILTQVTAEFALGKQSVFDGQIANLIQQRESLSRQLEEVGMEVFPSQANFVTFRVVGQDADTVFADIKKAGVLIKNLNHAGGLLRNCLRVTVGLHEENHAFMEGLRKALKP